MVYFWDTIVQKRHEGQHTHTHSNKFQQGGGFFLPLYVLIFTPTDFKVCTLFLREKKRGKELICCLATPPTATYKQQTNRIRFEKEREKSMKVIVTFMNRSHKS